MVLCCVNFKDVSFVCMCVPKACLLPCSVESFFFFFFYFFLRKLKDSCISIVLRSVALQKSSNTLDLEKKHG